MKRFLLILLLALPGAQALCCTTAIVSAGASKTGRPMIWKQRDASDVRNGVYFVQGEKYCYTAVCPVSDASHTRAYAGMNVAGFAICNNLSYNLRPDSATEGPFNGQMMAQALGCCRTLSDFEALLDARPRPMNLSSNFAVIDAEGGAAYFEVSDSTWVRYDVPEGGYLYRTNFSLSGDSRRAGAARYATIEDEMRRHAPRRFVVEFFLDAGRSFVNALTGGDALRGRRGDFLFDHDFIPRDASASSVIIEGVAPGGRPDSALMWCVPGYPPCSYAVPVWAAAGEDIPEIISGDAPANEYAFELCDSLRTLDWDSRYIDVDRLEQVSKAVRRAERAELKAGRKLDAIMRKDGFDAAAVREFNAAASRRFQEFKGGTAL